MRMTEPSDPAPRKWVMSGELAAFLTKHRDNDVKVEVRGHRFAVADAFYDRLADSLVIEIDTTDVHYQDLRFIGQE